MTRIHQCYSSNMKFRWSDGWLLTALWLLKLPSNRAAVIRYGDAINCAIFKPEEIDEGIARLEEAGLARVTPEGLFAITPQGHEYVDAFYTQGKGTRSLTMEVSKALAPAD